MHTLYARRWKAPDLLLTVLILGVTLWINSLSSRELNATPPPESRTSKFHMDDGVFGGGGAAEI